MVGFRDERFRNVAHQLPLRLEGCLAILRQPQAVRYAEHMGIYSHRGLVEDHRRDDIGRLPSDAGKFHQFFDVAGHFPVVIAYEHPRHACQMLGFIVWIRNAFDVFENHFGRGFRHDFCRRKRLEEGRSNEVYPFVGALCRKNHGDQQLKGRVIMQFGFRHGDMRLEPVQNGFVSFLFCHRCCVFHVVANVIKVFGI